MVPSNMYFEIPTLVKHQRGKNFRLIENGGGSKRRIQHVLSARMEAGTW